MIHVYVSLVDTTRQRSSPNASQRGKPDKPPPYSGTLIKRSLDMSDTEGPPISYRDRSKSSSHLEDRVTNQLILTKNRQSSASRLSAQSLNYTCRSVSPSAISIGSDTSSVTTPPNDHERLTDMPTEATLHVQDRECGPETQEANSLHSQGAGKSERIKSDATSLTSEQETHTKSVPEHKEEKKDAMSSYTESDLYVFMAATDSIRESISSPHLLEDNMYVTMTPVSHRRPLKKEPSVHEYYNISLGNGGDRMRSSLPDLVVKQPSIEDDGKRPEERPTSPGPPNDNKEKSDVYEEVDYDRPVPPPRRKKLMKLQSQLVRSSQPPPSPAGLQATPNSNRYTYTSDTQYTFLRKRTSTSPGINSPNRQRRPVGMVFNDIVIPEILEKGTTTSSSTSQSLPSQN